MRFALLVLLLLIPATALADSCYAPPSQTSPTTCTVSNSNRTCSFGPTEDGIVEFSETVTVGGVDILGGRYVKIGPGKIVMDAGNPGHAFSVNPNNNLDGTIYYLEGMYIDSGSQVGGADAFSIRNQDGIDQSVYVVNSFFTGLSYADPGEHGDLIQNQAGGTGSLALYVQNFYGITTDGQGFFIPDRTTDGVDGIQNTTLDNVWIYRGTGLNLYDLWFWSPTYAPSDPQYTVSLTDVSVYNGDYWPKLGPETGTTTGGVYDWSAGADAAYITGTVNQWDGTNPPDYASYTGDNYDRAHFCGSGNAVSLNGSSDYISFGDVYDFPGTAEFSAVFRLYVDSTQPHPYARVASKEDTANVDGWSVLVNSGILYFYRQSAGSDYVSGSISADTWHDICVAYDGSVLSMEIDGSRTTASSTRSLPGNAYGLTFGRAATSGAAYFSGDIRNFSLWSAGLNQNKCNIYRGKTLNGTEDNLASYWDTTEGSGSTLTDTLAVANGTINGGTWVTDSETLSVMSKVPRINHHRRNR